MVFHGDENRAGFRRRAEIFCSLPQAHGKTDFCSGVTVVDGIADQVVKDPLQLVRVTEQLYGRLNLCLPGQLLFRQHGQKFADHLFQHTA